MFIELQDRGSRTSSVDREKARLEASNVLAGLADFDDPNLVPESAIAGLLEDDSPYPEVRSAVANTDDPSMLVSTLRAWVIGVVLAVVLSATNQFFYFRYPTISLPDYFALLLAMPMGRAWASTFPNWSILGISLNPGPFTIKEHVLLQIIASVNSSPARAMDLIGVQRVVYNQTYHFGFQWMLVMATQMIGFSIGGILRRFLVQPPSMMWPNILATCTLFNTLHGNSYAGMGTWGGSSRQRIFLCVCAASMCWHILPGYLFRALSNFSWVCWIAPDNIVVNQLFGYRSGLGMSLLTFDWAQITYGGDPLVTPWWAEANSLAGYLFFFWFLVSILYYTNTWYSQYLPIFSGRPFDNTGNHYNVSRIINDDLSFNSTAYEQYSPLFLSTTFVVAYGLAFASITATLVHTFLYFRKQIWTHFWRPTSDQHDVHARLMSRYKQVPEWWYAIIFVPTITMCIVLMEVCHTQLPIWALFLSLFIALVYAIPVGMIDALTDITITLNVVTEVVIGYLLPGRPLAGLMFKVLGYNSINEATEFAADLKLGHYMKVPPRLIFWAQIVGTIVAGTVQLFVMTWMFEHIPDFCTDEQKDGFSCPNTQIFGTASVIWGVIGPKRIFSPGHIYSVLLYGFLFGAICPVIVYAIQLKRPYSIMRYVNFPLIFSSWEYVPPAGGINYITNGIISFVFQYYIRRKYTAWWMKYNYVVRAALNIGLSLMVVFIFFALQYPKNGTIGLNTVQAWWGNTVFLNTADAAGLPLKTVPEGSTFGPSKW